MVKKQMKNNGDKITAAEFRGKTLAHLENIKEDIRDMKRDLKTKACKKDLDKLGKKVDNMKLTSTIVGGIGGIIAATITGMIGYFGLRRL